MYLDEKKAKFEKNLININFWLFVNKAYESNLLK